MYIVCTYNIYVHVCINDPQATSARAFPLASSPFGPGGSSSSRPLAGEMVKSKGYKKCRLQYAQYNAIQTCNDIFIYISAMSNQHELSFVTGAVAQR